MEKTQSVTKAPPASAAGYPAAEQPVARAQKRLVTQSERDTVAGLPPQPALGALPQAVEAERAGEGQ